MAESLRECTRFPFLAIPSLLTDYQSVLLMDLTQHRRLQPAAYSLQDTGHWTLDTGHVITEHLLYDYTAIMHYDCNLIPGRRT